MNRAAKWTDERVALLKLLWPTTRTVEIAERLGADFTRNMVIGKAHRLGLPAIDQQEFGYRCSVGREEARQRREEAA